jgi:hypothetical protein
MARYSKPCRRANRGCRRLVEAEYRSLFDRLEFCSRSCSTKHLYEIGRLKTPTREQQSLGGRISGPKSAETRRRKAVLARAERVRALLGPELLEALSFTDERRLVAVLGRIWHEADQTGYHRALVDQRRQGANPRQLHRRRPAA